MSRYPARQALQKVWRSDHLGPVILALIVGVLGGAGAIVFRELIDLAGRFFTEGGAWALPFLGDAYVILLPMVGLVVVSTIVRKWAPEAEGHGVPEVMYAVKKEGGRIRPRVAGVKALASAICIGSGGSVGREGPIVQIGCTIGSSLGQFLKQNEHRVRLLVACGAAAGIAGTFNAPIAGVIFAMEVILGNFESRSFGLVVISSAAATALCRAVLGDAPAFLLEQIFSLKSAAEIPLYIVLGLLAGLLAVVTVKFLYFLENLFSRWTWPAALKAAIAGLMVGGLGYFSMKHLGGGFLFGVGYDGIEEALHLGEPGWNLTGQVTILTLALLAILKLPAMSLTLAGGGSGGVFAPSIFIGAMLGGAFGLAMNAIFPSFTAPAGAYALVGMGAVFAGTAHAPITAILILFELTDDYKIIVPLMFAVVISFLVSSRLNPDSVYTIKLRRRGGLTPPLPRSSVLDQILVVDAMSTDYLTISPEVTVEALAAKFHGSHTRSFEVIDDENRLVGIVTEFDLETALMSGNATASRVRDIMTSEVATITPDCAMSEVVRKFAQRDVGQIPVVAKDDPERLIGVLRRGEIFWAYGQLAMEHRSMLLETVKALPDDHGDAVHVHLEVKSGNDRLCYKKIRDIRVPDQCLIVVLHRGERSVVPRGETVVEPGDTLVILTIRARRPKLREWVSSVTA